MSHNFNTKLEKTIIASTVRENYNRKEENEMAFSKEYLAKLGIAIDKDEVDDETGQRLIEEHVAKTTGDQKKLKELNDQYSSEIADYKRKERERMTEDEKRKADEEDTKARLAETQKQLAIRDKVAMLVELGYDRETATKYATDEVEGKDTIQYQKEFMAKREAEIRAKVLKEADKDPNLGQKGAIPTKEDVVKGGYEAMLKLKEDHPETFKQYFGDNASAE